jgi:NADPH:quinone reductase-like Zn-dependent oxidoreductase
MKAIRLYGTVGNQRVVLEEVPKPQIGAGEILVRVHATGVTPGELEWHPTLHTKNGDSRSQPILSHEFSGVIEEIAPGVTGLAEGDEVSIVCGFGAISLGAVTQYSAAAPSLNQSFRPYHLQTAVTPISGLTAWQALFDHGKIEAGQKVLIHGGAGGVGSFAIQLAAWKGALVVTTVSEANAEFVRSLGAQVVLDYRKTEFEEVVNDADLVLDLVGGETLPRSFKAIRKGGRVVTVATNAEGSQDPAVKEAFFIVETKREQLVELAKLIDEGKILPVVREVFPLEEAEQAFFTIQTGAVGGKTVLRVLGK